MDLDVLYSQIEWPQITRLLVLQKVEEQLKQQLRADSTKPIAHSKDETSSGLSAMSSGLTVRDQALMEKEAIVQFFKEKKASPGLIAGLEKFDEKSANFFVRNRVFALHLPTCVVRIKCIDAQT